MLRRIYPANGAEVALAEEYAYPLSSQGPWVRAIFISSLDGAATLDGKSGGLGSEDDVTVFALNRGLADVILVGADTARAEGYAPVEPDPVWGNVRDGRSPTPPIAVVSRRLGFDISSPLFSRAPDYARTIVVTCEAAPRERLEMLRDTAVDVVIAGDEKVDLTEAVAALGQRGYSRISCEGGPALLAQIAKAGLLNELCLTLSPLLVAGDSGRIANGAAIPGGLKMRLASVLDSGGYLFLRYTRSLPVRLDRGVVAVWPPETRAVLVPGRSGAKSRRARVPRGR